MKPDFLRKCIFLVELGFHAKTTLALAVVVGFFYDSTLFAKDEPTAVGNLVKKIIGEKILRTIDMQGEILV